MALSSNRKHTLEENQGIVEFPASSLTCKEGALLGLDPATGYAKEWDDTDGDKFIGICVIGVSAASFVKVDTRQQEIRGYVGNSVSKTAGIVVANASAVTDVDDLVYCSTSDLDANSTTTAGNEPIGRITRVVNTSTTRCYIRLTPQGYSLGSPAAFEGPVDLGSTLNVAGTFTAEGASTLTGAVTCGSTLDMNGTADAIILDTDADTTISAPTDDQIDFEVGGADAASITAKYLKLESPVKLDARETFEMFDDFNYQAINETDFGWILNAGSDDLAIDPAINTQENGVVRCTGGDGDGTTAVDGSQIIGSVPVQADSGGLVFECRARIVGDITDCAVNIGLTDVTTLEEPFSIATATITSNASDAACFVFDDDATTKEWFTCAVDTNTDDTGNAASGTAPTAGAFQVFRIEVEADGATIRFYIDGTLEATLTGGGITETVNLYPTVIVCSDVGAGAAQLVDVDYIYVAHTRS